MTVAPATSEGQPRASAPADDADRDAETAPDGARRRARSARLAAIPVAVGSLLAALYLAGAQRDAAHVDDANRLGAQGRYADAERAARRAEREPASTRARLVEAYALRDQGRIAEAERAFADVARADPNEWTVRRDHAVLLARLGRREAAAREMARALQLNPRMRLPPGFQRSGGGP